MKTLFSVCRVCNALVPCNDQGYCVIHDKPVYNVLVWSGESNRFEFRESVMGWAGLRRAIKRLKGSVSGECPSDHDLRRGIWDRTADVLVKVERV